MRLSFDPFIIVVTILVCLVTYLIGRKSTANNANSKYYFYTMILAFVVWIVVIGYTVLTNFN